MGDTRWTPPCGDIKMFFLRIGFIAACGQRRPASLFGRLACAFGGLHLLGRHCHFDGRPGFCESTLMPQHPRWKKLHSGCVRRVVILVLARY